MNSTTLAVVTSFVAGTGIGLCVILYPRFFPSADVDLTVVAEEAPLPPQSTTAPEVTETQIKQLFVQAYQHYRYREFHKAATKLEAYMVQKPDDRPAAHLYGKTLVLLKRFDDAIQFFESIIDIHPDDVQALYGLGWAMEKSHRLPEAMDTYRRAIAIDPEHALCLNNLAWLLATVPDDGLRNGAEAVRLARAARKAHGKPAAWLADTLAAALAEAGDFEGAVEAQTEARHLTPYGKRAEAQRRLEMYQQGRPFRLDEAPAEFQSPADQQPADEQPADEQPSDEPSDRPADELPEQPSAAERAQVPQAAPAKIVPAPPVREVHVPKQSLDHPAPQVEPVPLPGEPASAQQGQQEDALEPAPAPRTF